MNESIGSRIKRMRESAGLSQDSLAKAVGRSKSSVSQWESDATKPKGDALFKLAKALGCSPSWLQEGGDEPQAVAGHALDDALATGPKFEGMAPEISWVQAGAWTEVCYVDMDPETVKWYPRPPGASAQTFVLRVVGESMLPEYSPGRLIFVDPERIAQSGDDVIAVMIETSEATFKRYLEEPGSGRLLKALNPSWHEPYIAINGNCKILGVVVADMRIR
ncbi:S24 family peptidase [Salinicola sp. JS01]|uniref:LexA family protein n=1 Tax=Salinicola sp. JS01 TaxID=3050071 RepID=UPI00255BF317|nr:S24 family peptidase [Salinicola sp. JS01]WIX32543.1 S24 family peptidase [Salinicola sp. JS01]